MRNKQEIQALRDEVASWMDLINRAPGIQHPSVLYFLVAVHDCLTWALAEPAQKTELGIGFEPQINALRESMKLVKDKQHKHRNPLNN